MEHLHISNDAFLTALFGEDKHWVHVTDFQHDPNNIPKEQHLIAWKGDYYSRYRMREPSNQYFTISLFYCDEQQQARRRKALFRSTPVIVLDDVREKLSMDEVQKLPRPTWILETSQGSEQWGYLLDQPCTDRHRVENLLDGLVANGLAPDGRDPGMKGVTRYVRLPEGVNNKASKLIDGQPWRCQMRLWEPANRVTLEQLATPFTVDLDASRRETRVDGAAAVSDHPIINIPNVISIKEVRSDGRFDITCPWVEEHTGEDDSGSGVFTNSDGTIGFKCHHGACQTRTGADLLNYIEAQQPGFRSQLKNWQIMREMATVSEVSFMGPATPEPAAAVDQSISFMGPASLPIPGPVEETNALDMLCGNLRRERPDSKEARDIAQKILKHVDDLPKIEQKHWHDTVCDLMHWSKNDFRDIIKDLRNQWYGERVNNASFYETIVFVKELNQFYDYQSCIFFTPEAFQNSYSHEDDEAKKAALQHGRVQKVDSLDYAPKQPRIFVEGGRVYGNLWSDESQSNGSPGDVTPWLRHFDVLGWSDHRDHIMKWMAYTLLHPERKINHILLLGSGEGSGKDWLLYPLTRAMGDNYDVIGGEELLSDYHDYVLSTKYLHINEAELGDRREALSVSNKLKPLAAAPPEKLNVNQKGIKRIKVRNILNATMTTNSIMPLRLNSASRRFYACWSDFNPRDRNDNVKPEWQKYWDEHWEWMRNGGWEHVTHYLMTQVDISQFNPGAPPPMTEFLRDIREQSKSPMQQTIELFIQKKHGAFVCDILTASDMSEVLKLGDFMPADMLCDAKLFTPRRVASLLREMGVTQVRSGQARLWVLRDHDKYDAMSTVQVHHEYEEQIHGALGKGRMNIVKLVDGDKNEDRPDHKAV